MKKFLLVVAVVMFSAAAIAQENRFTLSGGYVFTNVEDADVNATGFRINGLYEFSPMGGNLAHGFSIGFLQTKASSSVGIDYTLNSWPIYYAPKYHFGNDKIKGFIKGALGMHSSNYKRTGSLGNDLESRDWGFYGGAGAGFMVFLKENVFLNAEYEWAYLSNSYYQDGFVNSIMGGLGFKF